MEFKEGVPSLFGDEYQGAAGSGCAVDAVRLSRKRIREVEEEEEEDEGVSQPAWMRYLPRLVVSAAPVGKSSSDAGGPVCSSRPRVLSNPFAPPSLDRPHRRAATPSPAAKSHLRPYKRASVDEAALLFTLSSLG
jgi:hypothetical protein